jgi:hypothetical protein
MNDFELVRQIEQLRADVERLKTLDQPRGAWRDWTPTITQGGSVTVAITFARYAVAGDIVHVEARLAITSAGTAGQAIQISGIPTAIQPANAGSNQHAVGTGVITDAGTAIYVGALFVGGANNLRMLAHNTVGAIGVDPNFGLASGDSLGFNGTWEC